MAEDREEVSESESICCLTYQLVRMNESKYDLYNRKIDKVCYKDIDPDGVHVLAFQMIHEHAGLVSVDPHLRCSWLMKVRDRKSPIMVVVDTPIGVFEENTFSVKLPKLGAEKVVAPTG